MTRLRRFVGISLVVFGVAVFYFLVAGLSPSTSGGGGGGSRAPATVSITPGTSGQPTQTGGTVISAQEVAKHSSESDCWIIVNAKVYNVSGYLNSHPGGPGAIAPYCGKEATNAFDTKDRGSSHSNRAWNHLDSLYVGDLGP